MYLDNFNNQQLRWKNCLQLNLFSDKKNKPLPCAHTNSLKVFSNWYNRELELNLNGETKPCLQSFYSKLLIDHIFFCFERRRVKWRHKPVIVKHSLIFFWYKKEAIDCNNSMMLRIEECHELVFFAANLCLTKQILLSTPTCTQWHHFLTHTPMTSENLNDSEKLNGAHKRVLNSKQILNPKQLLNDF